MKKKIVILGPFGYNLLLLKVAESCSKHCSKIIFKWINNTAGPILIFFNHNSTWTVREQCTHYSWTVFFVSKSRNKVQKRKEKRKKKKGTQLEQNVKRANQWFAVLSKRRLDILWSWCLGKDKKILFRGINNWIMYKAFN